jgi:hypothetical protein
MEEVSFEADSEIVGEAEAEAARPGLTTLEGYTQTIGTGAGPYPISGPAVVSSPLAKAIILLTAGAITADLIGSAFMGMSGEDQITKPGYNEGFENTIAFRDASGPSPSDFRIDASRVTPTGFEVSLLETPKRDRRWVVPFHITFQGPKRGGSIGAIIEPDLAAQFGTIPAVYSPPPDGHWSMQAPADLSQQQQFKRALADFGKEHKQPTGN